ITPAAAGTAMSLAEHFPLTARRNKEAAMTPEIEKKRREVFEAWLKGQGLTHVPSAWRAFNAALDAVEISHPGKFPTADSDGSLVWNKCCDVFTDAITATGLGLRIK
ncbi:hypothetical protein, partial [Bowmanella yangjiangensis]